MISRRSLLAGMAAIAVPAARAAAGDLVDVAGRPVTLERPARRLLLGEGRFLAALAALDLRDPVDLVAGMLGEFEKYDPAGFARWRTAHPGLAEVPTFGHTSEDSVSLETAIALRPDVAVFGLDGHGPGSRSERIIGALEAAGIPVVFIDFRLDPLANTGPSLRLLGRLLGMNRAAEAFATFHEEAVARVTDVLALRPARLPSVLLEVHVGLRPSCCFSIARGSLADLVAAAGGRNLARDALPGPVGQLNLEHVIAEAPEVYIGTAVGGGGTSDGRIELGPGVAPDVARASLARALDRPGVATLPAVRDGRAFGIWHHFYNSPLNAYALQRFAKWLHPEPFADLEPEATLAWMLDRARPVDLAGTYSIGLTDA